jgi:hypothetical protein
LDPGRDAYTPTNSSWLKRIETQFTALRYFTLDGTDHATQKSTAACSAGTSSAQQTAADERFTQGRRQANVA